MSMSAPDPLTRAREAARTAPPVPPGDDWPRLVAAVRQRVRATAPPVGDPVRLDPDPAPDGSRTLVAARVVRDAVRHAASTATAAPSGIELVVADAVLVRVDLTVVAAYGEELHALADAVRARVGAALADVVGSYAAATAVVDVTVADVVVGDPRRV